MPHIFGWLSHICPGRYIKNGPCCAPGAITLPCLKSRLQRETDGFTWKLPKLQFWLDICSVFHILVYMDMDQYLLIPFLGGWTSIYQLFWCSPGVQGFDTLPYMDIYWWFESSGIGDEILHFQTQLHNKFCWVDVPMVPSGNLTVRDNQHLKSR